MPKDDLERYQE